MVQFATWYSEQVSVFEVFSLRIHSHNCYQRRGWHLLYIVGSKGSLLVLFALFLYCSTVKINKDSSLECSTAHTKLNSQAAQLCPDLHLVMY